MGSRIFETDMYRGIEVNILRVINNEKGFLSGRTASSPRAAGDAIESIIADNFQVILGDVCSEYGTFCASCNG